MLLDDAADLNVVSQTFVMTHTLQPIEEAKLPSPKDFHEGTPHVYGAHAIRLRLTDSRGTTRDTEDIFYAIDIGTPSLLLGRP